MPITSIQLAFFESGHYMAVMKRLYEPLRAIVHNNNDNQSLTLRDD